MQQGFTQLRRTALRHAAAHRFAFRTIDFAAAHRTMERHYKRKTVRRLLDNTDNFRNDVATAFEHHSIVNKDSEALDFILVVQRCVTNGCPSQLHRLQYSDGSQRTGASNLDS